MQAKETVPNSCSFPTCVEQSWSNEASVRLSFLYLRAGGEYVLECRVSDPWGNTHSEHFQLHVPTTTTPQPPTTRAYIPPTRRTSTLPATMPPPPTTRQQWRYAPTEDESGWVRAIATTTQRPYNTAPVRAAPQPTPAPVALPSGTADRWSARRQPQEQSTTTSAVPGLGFAMPSGGRMGPTRLYTNLALGASSAADAELLQWPGAISAIVTAVRAALTLNDEDSIDVQDMALVPPSGRRLANTTGLWQVRVRLLITTMGQVHSSTVSSRLHTLGTSAPSEEREVLREQLQVELLARGLGGASGGAHAVLGAEVWQDGEPAQPLLTAAEASAIRAGELTGQPSPMPAPPGDWQQSPEDISSTEDLMLPIMGATVGVSVCVLASLICVIFAWHNAATRNAELAIRGPRIAAAPGPQPSDEPMPHKIAWQPEQDHGRPGMRCPTPASTCSTATGGSGSTNPPAASSQLRTSGSEDPRSIKGRLVSDEVEVRSCNSPAEPSNLHEVPDPSAASPPTYFFMPQQQQQQQQQQQWRTLPAGRQLQPLRRPSGGRGLAVSPGPRAQARQSGTLKDSGLLQPGENSSRAPRLANTHHR